MSLSELEFAWIPSLEDADFFLKDDRFGNSTSWGKRYGR